MHKTRARRGRAFPTIAGLVATAMLATACGSSGSTSSSVSKTTSSSTAASSVSASAAATSSNSAASTSSSVSASGSAAASSPATGAATEAPQSGAAIKVTGSVSFTLSMQEADVQHTDPATWGIVQAFMKQNPNIKVNVEGQPVDQHTQKMVIAAQSHTLPEIFWIPDATAQQMAGAGDLLDLTNLLSTTGLKPKFKPSVLSAYNNGKVQYGLPYEVLITGFFYNNAILKSKGVTVPTTSDDLLTACKTLSQGKITPIAMGANQSAFSVWAFLGMLSRFGYEAKYKAILAGTASYNNPDFLRLYNYIAQMRMAGCFPSNVSTQTYQQALDNFGNGAAAMFDSGVFAAGLLDHSKVAKDLGFWVGPTFPNGVGNPKTLIDVPSVPLAVSAKVGGDPNKLAAVEKFFAFFYSDQGQQIYAANGKPPVTTLSPKVDGTTQPAFAATLAAANMPGWVSPAGQPDLVVPTAVGSAMYDSIYGVIEGQLSPQKAVELVQAAFAAAKK